MQKIHKQRNLFYLEAKDFKGAQYFFLHKSTHQQIQQAFPQCNASHICSCRTKARMLLAACCIFRALIAGSTIACIVLVFPFFFSLFFLF